MTNEIKDRGIVLKVKDYGENDKLVTLFTLEHGKITVRMRGVKKKSAKLAFASQLFCFAEYLISKNKDFYTVINANAIDNFFNLTQDLNNYYGASIILQATEILIREDEPNPKLFITVLNSLKALEYLDKNVMLVISKFLILSMNISGYQIDTKICLECGNNTKSNIFSFDHGSFVCAEHAPTNSTLLSEKGAKLLRAIDELDFDSLPEEASGAKNVMKLLGYYFEEKTETILSSLKIFL